MKKQIAILSGDGIGPEVMAQALRVLEWTCDKESISLECIPAYIGGAAYERYEHHFPQETQKICASADAILLGSVGGPIDKAHLPKWKNCEANALLALRKTFSFNINLRPAKIYKVLRDISPLKSTVLGENVEILIVRELMGDVYFGEHYQGIKNNQRYASDLAEYNESQIAAVAHQAFQAALSRSKKVTSVDKANVLATSKLWREVVTEIATHYPEVALQHMLVDNCAMQLILNPRQFDVILTSNLFGDILSDAASVIPGSLGLMPSASINEAGFGLYEPAGGSAPDLADKNIANPIAQILSTAMMLRYSFHREDAAERIENAILKTLEEGYRTRDIAKEGDVVLGTKEFTDKIIENL